MGAERLSKESTTERRSAASGKGRQGPPALRYDIIGLQHTIGNQQVSRLLTGTARPLQRAVVEDYKRWIKKPLSTGFWSDWKITERDCLMVIGTLDSLDDGQLLDTYNRMQADGLWKTLSEEAPKHVKKWHDVRWRLVGMGQHVFGTSSEDKLLAELQSALSASERGFSAAAELTKDPAVQRKMRKVASRFKLASSTLGKGVELVQAAKSIHKFAGAAADFWNADLRSDQGADSVVALFSAIGEVGDLLPDGIWQAPFDVFGAVAGVVSMVDQEGDLYTRKTMRDLREYIPR